MMNSLKDDFEKFWLSVESDIGDKDDFLRTSLLILEILKSESGFDKFYDESGAIKPYFELCKLKKIQFTFDPKLSTWQIIHDLLKTSRSEGKAGYVAKHLVGAKLQLRFPDVEVSTESASTADKPTNHSGDFAISNTIFHITLAPGDKVIEKCRLNINEGYRVYLLVPSERLGMIHSQVQDTFDGKVQLVSIENFISQNIDEIGKFGDKGITIGLINLLQLYNQRVDAVERDKSLMIEIPNNLIKLGNG